MGEQDDRIGPGGEFDRALELGTFPAAPAERQCDFCDFRPACGPDQERRVRRKSPDLLGDLKSLRELP